MLSEKMENDFLASWAKIKESFALELAERENEITRLRAYNIAQRNGYDEALAKDKIAQRKGYDEALAKDKAYYDKGLATNKALYEQRLLEQQQQQQPPQQAAFIIYQGQAARTASKEQGPMRLAVSGLGITGEAGEVADLLKKMLGHGHPPDIHKITKELGDVLWYISDIATTLGISLSEVARVNIEKLRERYPEGFSEEASRNRRD